MCLYVCACTCFVKVCMVAFAFKLCTCPLYGLLCVCLN